MTTQIFFETGINLLETFILIEFISEFLGTKYQGKKRNLCFAIAWLINFVEICIVNHFTYFETYASYIPSAIYLTYSFLCLRGSAAIKIIMSVITQAIVMIIAILTNLIICNFIGYDPIKLITVFNSTRVSAVIISKLILIFITRLILKFKITNIKKSQIISLIIIPMISIISLCFLLKATFYNREAQPYILIGMLCIVIADAVTYYFMTVIDKEYKNSLDSKLLRLQIENMNNNIEEQKIFVDKMKNIRHDLKNHLITLNKLIDSEDIEKAKEYIKTLTDDNIPLITDYVKTDSEVFDSIINSKISICSQKKIFVCVYIKEGTSISFNHIDTVTLFGNLIDNAIEAAEKSEGKRITINIYNARQYLAVEIDNSIDKSVLENNKTLKTTKENKEFHGIGLKSVKNVVEKYNGMISFYEEYGEFRCHVLLDKDMLAEYAD